MMVRLWVVRICLRVLASVALFAGTATAEEWPSLVQKIRQSHARIRQEVFTNVTVEVRMQNIVQPGHIVQTEWNKAFTICGEQRMMRDGTDILASNKDYRFRVNDADGQKELGYLEGKKRRNMAAEKFEERLGGVLLLSTSLSDVPLLEALADRAFVVDSVLSDADTTTLRGNWERGDERFGDIMLQLDPNNLYQVVAAVYTVRRPTYTIRVTRSYSYTSEPFDGTTIRLPVAFEQEIVELVDNSPAADALSQKVVYSGWQRAPDDPAIFRLSGYGFPEPDLEELNGSRSPFRLLACIYVGVLGVLLTLFGKRLFWALKTRAST